MAAQFALSDSGWLTNNKKPNIRRIKSKTKKYFEGLPVLQFFGYQKCEPPPRRKRVWKCHFPGTFTCVDRVNFVTANCGTNLAKKFLRVPHSGIPMQSKEFSFWFY
uniref:Uncharacterized protein n=1 Tax=Micrurus lemniscatus lemniscatus TaxID=129467 RepID=A0A2D4JFQ8_MICLE